jgi:hypothetical protein
MEAFLKTFFETVFPDLQIHPPVLAYIPPIIYILLYKYNIA